MRTKPLGEAPDADADADAGAEEADVGKADGDAGAAGGDGEEALLVHVAHGIFSVGATGGEIEFPERTVVAPGERRLTRLAVVGQGITQLRGLGQAGGINRRGLAGAALASLTATSAPAAAPPPRPLPDDATDITCTGVGKSNAGRLNAASCFASSSSARPATTELRSAHSVLTCRPETNSAMLKA